jgi:hypothetical protein
MIPPFSCTEAEKTETFAKFGKPNFTQRFHYNGHIGMPQETFSLKSGAEVALASAGRRKRRAVCYTGQKRKGGA